MHARGQGGVGGGGVSKKHVKVKGGVSKNQAWHILHCTSPPLPINNDQSLMHMDRRTYTKHGLPRYMDHPCGPTILDKSPWDSAAIFIYFCYFSVPSFSKFSCSSPSPHPMESWNSEKILDTQIQHCGVRGGVGPVWIGKCLRNAKVSQDFCPWL